HRRHPRLCARRCADSPRRYGLARLEKPDHHGGMRTDTPKTIYLKDYTPPAYHVRHVDMVFEIFEGRTRVTTTTRFAKNTGGDLFLNGEELTFFTAKHDGVPLIAKINEKGMTIPAPGKDEFPLEVVTDIHPETNTALEGLYNS